MGYSSAHVMREQRETLDWIAHEAAAAIRELTQHGERQPDNLGGYPDRCVHGKPLAEFCLSCPRLFQPVAASPMEEGAEMNALELGAAIRRLGLAGSGSAPPVCPIHKCALVLSFYQRPGSPMGNGWSCPQCAQERRAQQP